MENGKLKGAVMVSQGEVVEVTEERDVTVSVEPEPHSEEEKADETRAVVEISSVKVECLAVEDVGASKCVEVDGDAQGGSTDSGDVQISVDKIVGSDSRVKLAEAMKADQTLTTARALADELSEGYYWNQGLLCHSRLDVLGDSISQLCLSLQYRTHYLTLAH